MSEYRHTIHKTGLQGTSQDPPQNVSNAGAVGFNQPLTIQNAAMIGIAGVTAKKLISNFGGAIVDQLGNSMIEEYANVAQQGLGYVVIGVATSFNPVILGAKATIDISTSFLNSFLRGQANDFENERKMKSSGTKRTMLGDYYG